MQREQVERLECGDDVVVSVNGTATVAAIEAIGPHIFYGDDIWLWLTDKVSGRYLGEYRHDEVLTPA